MARTAPVPNIPPIPGMCPSVAVAGGGSDSGGSGGQGAGSGKGGGPGKGGGAADGTGGDGKAAPDPNKYPLCGTKSHPVDVVTGRAFTHPIVDFETAGPIPFVFERSASSNIYARDFGLGPTWGHSLGWELEIRRDEIWAFTELGTKITFPVLAVGAEVLGPFGWKLRRDQTGYELDADDDLYRRFDLEQGNRCWLTQIHDQNDNRISLEYATSRGNAPGALQRVVDSGGRQIRVQSDDGGHIKAFFLDDGKGQWLRLAEYDYDKDGRLVRAADAEGHAHYYAYNDRNQLTLDQDRTGLRFHFVYDASGRCVESWGDYGDQADASLAEGLPKFLHDGVTPCRGIHHCVFEWGEDGFCQVTDSTQGSNFFGNPFGLLDKMIEGGAATTATYRADGHLVSITDGEGATETYERDVRGHVTKTTDGLGRVTTIDRDAHGFAVRMIDAAGGELVATRDYRGDLESVRDAAGAVTFYEVDSRGLVTKVTDPVGGVTRYTYDTNGNCSAMALADGASWQYTFDVFGRRTSETDPLGNATRYGYSPRGDLILVIDAQGAETRYQYDGEGQLIESVSPKGAVTRYTWGGYHRLCTSTDPNGNTVRMGYNTEGELTHVWNEKGEVHRLAYGPHGLLREEHTFDGRHLRYSYDKAGRLTRLVGGDDKATEYVWDLAGQLVERTLHDGAADQLEYDLLGSLIRAKSSAGVECMFERDPIGRIVREVQSLRGKAHEVRSGWDDDGERVSRATSLGHQEHVSRDKSGQRRSTTLDGRVVKHTPDALGRETKRELMGGGLLESLFDSMGRLSERRAINPVRSVSVGVNQPAWVGGRPQGVTAQKAFRYDFDGELTDTWDSRKGGTEFRYDPLGQLLAMVPAQARAELFRYDAAGNFHEEGQNAPAREYGPGNRLTRKGNTHYRWDDSGRLIEKRVEAGPDDVEKKTESVWRYTWNSAGLMASAESSEGVIVDFVYDVFARRLEKRVSRKSDTVKLALEKRVRFVWDGDVLVHEIREEGLATGDPVVHERTYWFEDDGFEPLAHFEKRTDQESDGAWFHYVNDPNGTPERLVDERGDVACELERNAWGDFVVVGDARTTTPIRLQGQYADEETGLSYQRWRYYDGGLFISADPLELEGGDNAFLFAENAFQWSDPLGLQRRNKNGRFSKRPGPEPTAGTGHGNSKNSSKPTVLYAMINDKTGKFQKWGITDKEDPNQRYSGTMPRDCNVYPMAKGKRSAMLKLEKELTEKQGGPRNKERGPGGKLRRNSKKGQPLSKKAQKAADKLAAMP